MISSCMSYKRKSLLFKYGKELIKTPMLFVDVGARGNLSQPFADIRKKFPELLKVVAFEPDNTSALALESNLNGELVVNKAAWSRNENLTLFMTKEKSASSLFQPSQKAEKVFHSKHFEPRIVTHMEKIQGVALDEVMGDLNDVGGSFLKCDTQGSEFEVISGASNYLKTKCVGVTMECWTQPVYEGSHTVDEVISLIRKLDFEIFDVQVSAAWNRRTNLNSLVRKKQVVGLDFLAFKNMDCFYNQHPSDEEILRFVLLADLWGYADYALQILNHESCLLSHEFREELIKKLLTLRKAKNFENKNFIFHRDLLRSKFKLCPRFPLIH